MARAVQQDHLIDGDAIANLGWRQGSFLGPKLAKLACDYAPRKAPADRADLLVVSSHDCDIVNFSLEKEPVVEVLGARRVDAGKIDARQQSGRNPRTLQIRIDSITGPSMLSCSAHDRWAIPRGLLLQEPPAGDLPPKMRRLVAEWLAKRYIRAAFPTAFDQRWRARAKAWQTLLKKHSEWIQGVYLRLSTLDELPEGTPYRCHIMLAVPHGKRGQSGWARKRLELEQEVEAFWNQFEPAIACGGVEPLGTDEITLADIEPYQRFDADWVSFEDDTPTTPTTADMPA
ncbi:MAG: hypothetical protein F4137_10660 [Acidobacteria bacterium]|nr:hypothetical protein [Acidobacteriota bacterium]